MAKAQASRFVMEVAPPRFVPVVKHRVSKILDTIVEEERDAVDSTASSSSPLKSTASCFMRDLEKSLSIHGQEWPRPSSQLAN